jgi:hypothetical protein
LNNLVYKYRECNKDTFERDLKAIKENYFWSANPKLLNDPFETQVNNNFIIKFVEYLGHKLIKNLSDKDIKLINENTNQVLNLDSENGIYSLSQNNLDELLWAHYADSHKGYWIEYDTNLLLNSLGKQLLHFFNVNYSQKPPSNNLLDLFNNKKLHEKMGSYKSKRWEYEKEFRIITKNQGAIYYSEKSIKSICFGLRIDENYKIKIMDSLNVLNLSFYQIELIPNTYKLRKILL